jgi:phosphate transport system permease protein
MSTQNLAPETLSHDALSKRDGNLVGRQFKNNLMLGLCIVAAGIGLLSLFLVLYFLASQGLRYMSWNLFTKLPDAVEPKLGGVANSLLGTLLLLLGACLFALPIGILGGIYQLEAKGPFANLVRFMTDVLNGIPSIVIGIFVYAVWVYPVSQSNPGKGFSVFAGAFALGIMMIPLIMRTTEEMLRLVPGTMREASLGLGATRWRTMWSVVLPIAKGGVITGIMLSLARVAGETAPLLFTILGSEFYPSMQPVNFLGMSFSIPVFNEPVDALPLRVYKYASGPDTDQNNQAWATALILISLVLIFSVAARFATKSNIEEK